MSFDDRLLHTLVIKRASVTLDGEDAPVLDDYGQPVTGETTFAVVDGLIQPVQPRDPHEVPLVSQGGAVISTHVGYMRPLAGLTTADWIEHDGIRYDITGMPDAAGLGHHLELALRAVI